MSEYQKGGLIYKYQAFQDYENALQKTVRDDVETVIIRAKDDVMYEIFPKQDDYACWSDHVHGGTGPTRRKLAMAGGLNTPAHDTSSTLFISSKTFSDEPDAPQKYLGFVLPDLSEPRWVYKGSKRYKRTGVTADTWEWDLTEGGMDMRYRFYADKDGNPLELNMLGVNLYTGGHKDLYIAYYHDYKEVSTFPDGTFDPPSKWECSPATPDFLTGNNSMGRWKSKTMTLLRNILPNVHWGDAAYDRFVQRHGRRHKSQTEYDTRQRHFEASRQFVNNWNEENKEEASASQQMTEGTVAIENNKKTRRHRVALNKFADWSREEYLSLLGRKSNPSTTTSTASTEADNEVFYKVATLANLTSKPNLLPAEMIWRGTPADSPVKDQAACGSCWAFSTIASLESAVYRTTGKQTLLSEQEMIDCGWEAPGLNTGCFGGEQDRAFAWALKREGVARQKDYPYRGINDFCKRDVEKVPIKGHMVMVKGGEPSLQAALISKGPMAVSVDASSDEFRFYAGGLYDNPECATDSADLNHAVIASGYGIDKETGIGYWLVKNMWSPNWGEGGYIRIARGKGKKDCGIATQPIYVEIDGE